MDVLMTTNEIYETGRKRVAEMRQAQADRRAEVAKILRDYPKQVERAKRAQILLFSLLVAGMIHEGAYDEVKAYLNEEAP